MSKYHVTDGADVVPITKAKIRSWIGRTREDLRALEQALRTDDIDTIVEFAHDASGSTAELENIADTSKEHWS